MSDGINTHNARLLFGKHKGELLTRVPERYLTWGIGSNCHKRVQMEDGRQAPFCTVALAELGRRGVSMIKAEITPHSINRLSTRFASIFAKTRDAEAKEGLHTWAQRMVTEAIAIHARDGSNFLGKENDALQLELHGIGWVINTERRLPVLITVLKPKESHAG